MESEQSVKSLLEMAFNIVNPNLTSFQINDELWPIKLGIKKLEPFIMSYSQAVNSLLNIQTQVNSIVYAASDSEFGVKYEECELFDKGTFLLIACDAVDQVLSCSSVNENCLDVSILINEFNPKNLDLSVGEVLDNKKLKQGLISSILNESGVLQTGASRKVAQNVIDEFDIEQNKTPGPSL
ncbi:hypothetical protein HNW13_018255 [Shewanella sp. BF02_Schw]|uniref:hypothetical protein n=1 Tax=Shewanella sp. BF02_Schw TaxID=394908 RepID=UPI00177EC211|nr:hypothetical protein [Shewanella sp. BF02_Schw]MBO1897684.1 hypothetical protein [Shewanella sp. BF02_Schw]